MTEQSRVLALDCPAYIADSFACGLPSPNPGRFIEYVFSRYDYAALGMALPGGNGKSSLRPEATIRMPINLAFDLAVNILKIVGKFSPEERAALGLPRTLELELPDEVVG